jgi:hypothetical protein
VYYATKFISNKKSFTIKVPGACRRGFESLNVGLIGICPYSDATVNNPMFKGQIHVLWTPPACTMKLINAKVNSIL